MTPDRVFEVLTSDWRRMVDEKVIEDPRYLHQGGQPVEICQGSVHENVMFPPGKGCPTTLPTRLTGC
jgi:hypothetical protein